MIYLGEKAIKKYPAPRCQQILIRRKISLAIDVFHEKRGTLIFLKDEMNRGEEGGLLVRCHFSSYNAEHFQKIPQGSV